MQAFVRSRAFSFAVDAAAAGAQVEIFILEAWGFGEGFHAPRDVHGEGRGAAERGKHQSRGS